MVEFGLKLEDNKNAEWSEKYIDYERLKKLLKAAQKATEVRKELASRHPTKANEIQFTFERDRQAVLAAISTSSIPRSHSASTISTNLNQIAEGDENASIHNYHPDVSEDVNLSSERTSPCGFDISGNDNLPIKNDDGTDDIVDSSSSSVPLSVVPPHHALDLTLTPKQGCAMRMVDETPTTALLGEACATIDETSTLLQSKMFDTAASTANNSVLDSNHLFNYGSHQNLQRADSFSNFSALLRGAKGVFDNYESKYKNALEAEYVAMEKFSIEIYREVSKVNIFYKLTVDELQDRLALLKENVGSSYIFQKSKPLLFKDLQNRFKKRISATGTWDEEERRAILTGTTSNDEPSEEQKKEADSIQRALTDMNRQAKLLINFAIMNSTGFIKIVKKFNKTFPDRKDEFKPITENGCICGDGQTANALTEKLERHFADWFCDGNETEARSLMLPKKGDGLEMDWSQLRLGYRLGMCSVLMCWVTWDCIWGFVRDGFTTIGGRTAFPVFRGCGGLLVLHWLWGISVYVWNRHRVNYIFLFDFNPKIVDAPLLILEDATDETLVYLLLMLLYYKSGANDIPNFIPPGGYPFLLVLYTMKCLIFPWRTRKPLWQAILSVISTPITLPTFFHTYIADIFTSMVKVFQDLLWAACFILSGDFLLHDSLQNDNDVTPREWHKSVWYTRFVVPLICLFPLWIRFNQCLRKYADTRQRMPHLANAFKYAMSQTVTLFGAFHPLYLTREKIRSQHLVTDDLSLQELQAAEEKNWFDRFWLFMFIASSLYSFFWDVYFDWGLGRRKYGYLGPRLMYPKRMYYYAVICADLFLRFMWVTTLIPPSSGAFFVLPTYLTMVTMYMELLRRTLWGFFRLENEHRNNTAGFRRVGFVPLHFSTGHSHQYKEKKHIGWSVLGEVFVISLFVMVISAASVIAAQRATNSVSNK